MFWDRAGISLIFEVVFGALYVKVPALCYPILKYGNVLLSFQFMISCAKMKLQFFTPMYSFCYQNGK